MVTERGNGSLPLSYLISKMFQPTTKVRHSGMDAGIQSQGCETMSGTAPK
jgi:hypothetical protein